MKSISSFTQIYLHRDPIDFRKWVDGLVGIVSAEMKLDPYSSYLFLFTSRRRDRIKALYWDRTGFAVWYKRLEKEKFPWPKKCEESVLTLTPQQFEWLLDGYDFTKLRPHDALRYAAGF